MILILFAQESEARPTISRLQAHPVENEKKVIWSEGEVPCYYEFDGGKIVLSNLGLHSSQMSVTKYAGECKEIWNFGLAGSLNDALSIGEIFHIECVGKYVPVQLDPVSQEIVETTLPRFSLEGKQGRLISSDFPLYDVDRRNELSKQWDLIDMEGYGVAYAAHHLGKKCHLWKIVSDFASPGGRESIRKNKAALSERVAELIINKLDQP